MFGKSLLNLVSLTDILMNKPSFNNNLFTIIYISKYTIIKLN